MVISFYKLLFFHYLHEAKLYWRYKNHARFLAVDRIFKKRYRRFFDYAIAKRFYKKQGFKNCYQYGPTPILTLEQMVEAFGVKKGQRLLDLGCGTGRHLYFLHHVKGIDCTGVELVEGFYRFAKALSTDTKLHFYCKDLLQVSLEGYNWVLFFATSFEDEVIEAMIQRFLEGPKNIKIITTSFSLSEYNKNFRIEKEICVRYPWGKTSCYLNTR